MKVKQWITCEKEIEVDVSMEDIHGIFEETPDQEHAVLSLLSRFYAVMKIVDQSIIVNIEDSKKTIIYNFLTELRERFKPFQF